MIKLYQFEPAGGLENLSPFCLKLETYLRMAQIPYEAVKNADIRKAPKGKLPYIEDQGKVLSDSSFIIKYLKEKHGDALDAGLSPHQKSVALSFQRLLEENFMWVIVYFRFFDERFWLQTKELYFGHFPPLMRLIVPSLIRKKISRDFKGHGMGLHSQEEIYQIGEKDLKAVADFIGERHFFFGDHPSTIDATVYAFLANIYFAPYETPLKAYSARFPHLLEYCVRMRDRFYRD